MFARIADRSAGHHLEAEQGDDWMTRDEIIAAIREAHLKGHWARLRERLRRMDGGEIFHELFSIAAEAQRHGPACDAACLLFEVKPACPIPCKDAVRAMLSHWEISIAELPWYLAGSFGEEAIHRAIEELQEEPLGQRERTGLDTVRYWADIFFTLTTDEVRAYERRHEEDLARPASGGRPDERLP